MLRKTFIILTILALAVTFGWLGTSDVRALPLAQDSTPTAESDEHTEDNEHEHGSDRLDPGDASVRITSPADGTVLSENSVLVNVQTTSFTLGEDGNHFHLYVDGAEQGMSQGSSTSMMAIDLAPGEHMIEVVLTNGEHQELDATDMVTVQYDASARPSGSASTIAPGSEDNTALIIGIVVAVLVVGGAGFVIARRR